MNNKTPTHAGTHAGIQIRGFISSVDADAALPLDDCVLAFMQQVFVCEVSEQSEASCAVSLASTESVCASCCAGEMTSLSESEQPSGTNRAPRCHITTEDQCERWKRPPAQTGGFIIIIWHVMSIIDPLCSTAAWISDGNYVHSGIVGLRCWFQARVNRFSVAKAVIQGQGWYSLSGINFQTVLNPSLSHDSPMWSVFSGGGQKTL